ncbi:MAG: isoprenylcysteine carboxylmethyltransferase family protein [Pseudomonadota bacterium]
MLSALSAKIERLLLLLPFMRRTLDAEPATRSAREARRDQALALLWGALCHTLFAAAVGAMIWAMWWGMSRSLGTVPQPWSWLANILLLLQFPLLHSVLLTPLGRRLVARLGPPGRGVTLATTTFTIIASLQLLALFLFWTPTGVVWWRAEGALLWILTALYASCFLLLMKANWDAGPEVQSGLLGWAALLRGVRPVFPPLPVGGIYRFLRHPIYLAFALTTWTVPTWTPDQLLLASVLTAYCALGPRLKERRLAERFGDAWQAYRARTPFWLPRIR